MLEENKIRHYCYYNTKLTLGHEIVNYIVELIIRGM